ncbi:MAG: hypothetical protein HRU70_15310 [Phycisphaeraceae bacterium]|nr:MAG: hypothetical protein HRU70_15310 [Phycisphaeraceae bacterium]
MTPRPGVSAALNQLQHGATLAAAVIAVCLVVQMVVFGFVHFTEVRFERATRESSVTSADVVASSGSENAASAFQPGPGAAPGGPAVRSKSQLLEDAKAKAASGPVVEREPGRWDRVMAQFSGVASSVGVLATIVFTVQLALAVVVAAGASSSGVERVVGACTIGLFLAAFCLPLNEALTSMPMLGAFSGYKAITAASEEVTASGGGELGLVLNMGFVPAGALLALAWIVARLRQGVASIVADPGLAEAARRLEAELARVRSEGIGSHFAGRNTGAIGRAMETPIDPTSPDEVRRALDDLGRPTTRRPI